MELFRPDDDDDDDDALQGAERGGRLLSLTASSFKDESKYAVAMR